MPRNSPKDPDEAVRSLPWSFYVSSVFLPAGLPIGKNEDGTCRTLAEPVSLECQELPGLPEGGPQVRVEFRTAEIEFAREGGSIERAIEVALATAAQLAQEEECAAWLEAETDPDTVATESSRYGKMVACNGNLYRDAANGLNAFLVASTGDAGLLWLRAGSVHEHEKLYGFVLGMTCVREYSAHAPEFRLVSPAEYAKAGGSLLGKPEDVGKKELVR